MSPENIAHFESKKEAIHFILTGIGDEIYFTIDACKTAHEISHATTRHKGKEIAKPITPLSESASEEDNDPEQAQRDKDMQKNLALILWESKDGECCKQAKKGVPLQAEQSDWLADTDEEIDEQELEAHYSYMEKIQEVPTADSRTDSEPLEQTEFERYKAFNDCKVDYDKLKVTHRTNVSRPQLRSTQMKDKVVPNDSQVKDKKTDVEDQPRISSISNKTKSVTACNDSLKSKTLNAHAVCANCRKCLVDSDHFACVTKILNDVKARTKKPNEVPVSTRKPKSHANKYVATPPRKTVASESIIQKSKSYYRMLYEKTSKGWKW
nr:hypothetical protein [Tanacetum cinerariifolium]